MSEIIYCLTNPAIPDYVKIGRTTNLENRLKQLDTTGLPLPFEVFYAADVGERYIEVEKKLHAAFDNVRVRKNREFFQISPDQVQAAIEIADGKDVTPREDFFEDEDSKRAVQRANQREPYTFELLNIPEGSTLHFFKDEEITCTTIGGRTIMFEGTETTPDRAATNLMKKLGGKRKYYSGRSRWKYEGETLFQRRLRLEQEA